MIFHRRREELALRQIKQVSQQLRESHERLAQERAARKNRWYQQEEKKEK